MSALLGLLAPFWRQVAGLAAAVVAVLGIYMKGRRDASNAVERENLRREVESRRKTDVAVAEYRGDGGAAERLRDSRF